MTLLDDCLAKLDRGDAPDSRYPDRQGEHWVLCPYHSDQHAANFSVSERGYKCFTCGAKGGLTQLAAKVGVAAVRVSEEGRTPPLPPLTLEDYAKAKRLPVDFLQELGLGTICLERRQVVRIPYLDEAGSEIAVRFRVSMAGDKKRRFRWRRRSKVAPYGLWKLDEARAAGYVVLVEGESDAQTLWHYGLPAVGIPGANTWQQAWAQHFAGLTVYVWQEPDAGGEAFVSAVVRDLPGALVIHAPSGRKDLSECHLSGDDVPALLAAARSAAVPYAQIKAAVDSEFIAKAEETAARLLGCTDILGQFGLLCERRGLVGEGHNARILYLAVTSRLLDRPLSVVVKGPSSGGKSFTVEKVLDAFPPSAYYALSSMSEHALAYSQEPLVHRMLVLYEAVGLAGDFGSYLLRSLLSEGRVRYETVEKGKDGLVPRLIEREGPTGAITTTTWATLHPENETRMLSLTVRDDRDQTRAVFASLADRANGGGPAPVDLEAWQALQTWLELAGVKVVTIPFAHELAVRCEPTAVRLRRDFGAVLALIKAHAILHQRTRQIDQGRIVAELADYRAVFGLIADLMNEGVAATVKPEVRATVDAVRDIYAQTMTPVGLRALADHLDLDKSAVSRRVAVARGEGWIVNQETRKGQPAQLVPGDPMPAEKPVLPHPDTLGGGGRGFTIPPCTGAQLQCDIQETEVFEI